MYINININMIEYTMLTIHEYININMHIVIRLEKATRMGRGSTMGAYS